MYIDTMIVFSIYFFIRLADAERATLALQQIVSKSKLTRQQHDTGFEEQYTEPVSHEVC